MVWSGDQSHLDSIEKDIQHDIEKDLEVIEEEAKKINCEPVFKVLNAIGKLICDILRCFKIKNE